MENKHDGTIEDALYLLSKIENETDGFMFGITFISDTWKGRIIFESRYKIEYTNIDILVVVNDMISCIMRNRSKSINNKYRVNNAIKIP